MKIKQVTDWLEQQYPEAAAEEWDNVGLLVGDDTEEVSKILVALDATEEVVCEAQEMGAELIVTHHPMIFGSIKKINNRTPLGRKILTLAQNHMACYAMHTNYDILGMADLSADYLKLRDSQVLSVTEERDGVSQGLGRVGMLEAPMTLREFGTFVKEALHLSDVRIYGDPQQIIKKAAVCTGSGKSLLGEVYRSGADVYVTGDIDHHTGLDAVAEGLALVDAGHYGTEYVFAEAMADRLSQAFPNIVIKCAHMQAPYELI